MERSIFITSELTTRNHENVRVVKQIMALTTSLSDIYFSLTISELETSPVGKLWIKHNWPNLSRANEVSAAKLAREQGSHCQANSPKTSLLFRHVQRDAAQFIFFRMDSFPRSWFV
jgi:hypothetical protein